jgi:hypothetical protein
VDSRARLDELTRRWRERREARRPAPEARPRADDERQARAAAAFPFRRVSPAAYAAEYGADMAGFTYDEERYDDIELDTWLLALGELLRERRG